ncbi:deoxyribodipyrimidine photo-lyase [Paenibacillus filicis]|uniref:Deoxyribodipyrimidine photo-lyase n=1 Tax=Paenibacillus filicis TaxID=669464 RepID=A0ABU9DRR8_9BACL
MILFIHRKDLRTHDLPALDAIFASGLPSLHILVLDPFLLRNGRGREHSGRNFLAHAGRLQRLYTKHGRRLHVLYGEPAAVVSRIADAHPIREIVWHEDHTPYALTRDRELRQLAAERGIPATAYDEAALADLRDFVRWSGREDPYKVFTPFYKRWSAYVTERFKPASTRSVAELETAELHSDVRDGFRLPPELGAQLQHDDPADSGDEPDPMQALESFLDERLAGYADGRDRFAREDTSRISRHLNVGALSIREVYERLMEAPIGIEPWLRQLAWRDFYLYQSRLDPDFFRYEQVFDLSPLGDTHFRAWAEGRTGIPIIDAAMTELNETGWMPNRLRMITAMFLTKNLGCPFPYGERYFRYKLSDYDNVLNRGGWLWCASLGFDAAPYFRVMNPATQSETHDPSGAYIRRWLPHLAGRSDKEIHKPLPEAIVDLKASRAQAIETYKLILKSESARPAGDDLDAGADRPWRD